MYQIEITLFCTNNSNNDITALELPNELDTL